MNAQNAQTPINRVIEVFQDREGFTVKFDGRFYKRVGINQKRWGMLRAGSLKPTSDEIKSLAVAFKVPVTDLL